MKTHERPRVRHLDLMPAQLAWPFGFSFFLYAWSPIGEDPGYAAADVSLGAHGGRCPVFGISLRNFRRLALCCAAWLFRLGPRRVTGGGGLGSQKSAITPSQNRRCEAPRLRKHRTCRDFPEPTL